MVVCRPTSFNYSESSQWDSKDSESQQIATFHQYSPDGVQEFAGTIDNSLTILQLLRATPSELQMPFRECDLTSLIPIGICGNRIAHIGMKIHVSLISKHSWYDYCLLYTSDAADE